MLIAVYGKIQERAYTSYLDGKHDQWVFLAFVQKQIIRYM